MSGDSPPHWEGQPRDAAGPVFNAPWEAQVFSMTLLLHERGLFSWSEWAHALGAEIAAAQTRGDPDLGDSYYRHWLAALEGLLTRKGISSRSELTQCCDAWRRAAARTLHGRTIELEARDFEAGG